MPHVVFDEHARPTVGAILTITGEEAHHACRVKRLVVGDALRIQDGMGHIAHATIVRTGKARDAWVIDVRVGKVEVAERPTRIRVAACAPKGDRIAAMIEGLSQVGATSWVPLSTARAIVDPREAKLDKIRRTAIESLKQCGRPWLLEVEPRATLDALCTDATLRAGCTLLLADADGEPAAAWLARANSHQGAPIATRQGVILLVGPEGGWTDDERALARAHGAGTICLGPHILRTELAAITGAWALGATDGPPASRAT